MVDNKTLGRFISGINRGPLKNCKYIIDPRDKDNNAKKYEDALLENKKIYSIVVEQAYLDMCRTMTNVDANKKKDMIKAVKKQLVKYFKKNEAIEESDFDEWYKRTVKKVREAYGELTIGQVQKIINMSFKYLYCFRYFRKNKEQFFTHCHMPLDGITLNWYKKETSNEAPDSWSKLEKKNDYYKIIGEIRKKIKNKTMLEKDFEVWGEQKEKEALNEFL